MVLCWSRGGVNADLGERDSLLMEKSVPNIELLCWRTGEEEDVESLSSLRTNGLPIMALGRIVLSPQHFVLTRSLVSLCLPGADAVAGDIDEENSGEQAIPALAGVIAIAASLGADGDTPDGLKCAGDIAAALVGVTSGVGELANESSSSASSMTVALPGRPGRNVSATAPSGERAALAMSKRRVRRPRRCERPLPGVGSVSQSPDQAVRFFPQVFKNST